MKTSIINGSEVSRLSVAIHLMPSSTFKILKMLTQHPAYPELLLAQPRLPSRIQRPYLCTRLSNKERVNAIIHHYKAQTNFLGAYGFSKHISDAGITLATFSGKDGLNYTLHYISTHRLDREGESSIILKDITGKMVSEITFTLCQQRGVEAMIIGGLQGPNYESAQNIVHQATKNFYGLFPKRVLLETLSVLTELLNVRFIYAVSNHVHIYKAARYKNRTQYMHADYDAFWEISGGIRQTDGLYLLPGTLRRKKSR